MKLRKIKSTVLVIFIFLVVVFMLLHACAGDFKNAFACGAIAILSIMLLVIYFFDAFHDDIETEDKNNERFR